jgi:hypothetical protein
VQSNKLSYVLDSLTDPNTELFTILVGVTPPSATDPIPRKYIVPKALLSKIPYFQAMMQQHWIEGVGNTVLYADEKPAVILEFLKCLIYGRFTAKDVVCTLGWALTSVEGPVDRMFAFRCYVFGEMVGCASFRDLAMIAIHSSIRIVGKDIITYTFDNCHPDSSLYVWLVHYIVAHFGDDARLNITVRDLVEATSGRFLARARLSRGLQLPPNLRKEAIQEQDCYKAWKCSDSDLDSHLERLHEKCGQEHDDSMGDSDDEMV